MRDDWVSVVPLPSERAQVLADLTALAQHPGHIRTAGSASELLIPPYLAALYSPAPVAPKKRVPKKKDGDE